MTRKPRWSGTNRAARVPPPPSPESAGSGYASSDRVWRTTSSAPTQLALPRRTATKPPPSRPRPPSPRVQLCPVYCIHPTPDESEYESVEMLYVDPEECIDCDACVEACPVDACFAEDQLPEEWQQYTKINADYYGNR